MKKDDTQEGGVYEMDNGKIRHIVRIKTYPEGYHYKDRTKISYYTIEDEKGKPVGEMTLGAFANHAIRRLR